MPEKQVVSLAVFKRDVYLLAAMLLADEKVVDVEHVSEAAAAHYEDEVNRLLILIATAARQIMRRSPKSQAFRSIGNRNCGRYWDDSADTSGEPQKRNFFKSCSSIIHATEIAAYDSEKGYYTDSIRIVGEEDKKGRTSLTMLDGMNFAKCCIMLSKQAREEKQGEAGADSAPGPH